MRRKGTACPFGEEIPAKFVHVYGGRAARLASIVSGEPRLYHPCGIWHFDLALLQSYLESHDYITRAEYGALTGLLKYKAWQDLDKWVKAHLIDIKGRAPHRVYVKRKGQDAKL